MRILLGAFGDPGHAFPMLALGSALAARGHDVALQTWRRWEEAAVAGGMQFAAAPEYQVFPTSASPLKPYEAAVRAAADTVPVVREFAPDVAVSDVLTVAPALAAELCRVPVATLVPHLFPYLPPGFPPFALGARQPRTALGRRLWRSTDRLIARGLEQGRVELNDSRGRLGLEPLPWVHNGMSRSLTMVATLPALEPPRDWPAWARVVGPLMWEPPGSAVAPVAGSEPVVLVAPSTAQDAEHRLLRAALRGLAREPVRVIATYNGREPEGDLEVPDNAVLVPWLSYSKTMPACDLVVCHGGHGTLMRAFASGCPVVVVPAAGDMAENAARVDRAGLGVRLPLRFCTAEGVRLAVRRALRRRSLRSRAGAAAAWIGAHDGPSRAVGEVERWAAGTSGAWCGLRGTGPTAGRPPPGSRSR